MQRIFVENMQNIQMSDYYDHLSVKILSKNDKKKRKQTLRNFQVLMVIFMHRLLSDKLKPVIKAKRSAFGVSH